MPSHKVIGAAAVSGALAIGALFGATLGNPVTSGAESATTATTTTTPGGAKPPQGDHPGGRGGGVELEAAAKAIGITVGELRTELKDGKTIAAVAKAKGVDRQKVIDAMVAAGTKRLDEAKAKLPETMADVVDGKGPAGGSGMGGPGMGGPGGDHHGQGGPGGPGRPGGREGLGAAAKALGMTEAELRTALEGGTSLADVAQAKGVPVQKVIDALVAEAKTRIAAAVKAGKITQAQADERLKDLTQHITDRVNGTGGRHGN